MDENREPVAGGPDLLLALDRQDGGPLHEQLERALRDRVRSGRLTPGARMPSSRGLARSLQISRGVVLEAYAQLVAEGYLTASQGAPTRVARAPSPELPPARATRIEPGHRYDLATTDPDLSAFPRDEWLKSIKTATRQAPFAALSAGDPRGIPDLRNELMAYLGRARGAAPEPEHTLICAGFGQAFAALCRLLAARGVERIAIEQPGYPRHAAIAEAARLQPVPIGVDEHGIDVERLQAAESEAVVVTPAHQFPTGAVLSAERRAALLQWVEDTDGLIVEDDYDSELRYDREPIGALQGLAPERVCQIGSFAVRLAPALRLGWMLCPSWLTGGITYELAISGGGAPALDQLALADLIDRGELDRHLRRMRLRYRGRREALLAALSRHLSAPATPIGIAAGTFTLIEVAATTVDAEAVSAAAARGVATTAVDGRLLLAFGNVPDAALEQAIKQLAAAMP